MCIVSMHPGTVVDSNILEALQQEIAGTYMPYIDEGAVKIFKEIGTGTYCIVG